MGYKQITKQLLGVGHLAYTTKPVKRAYHEPEVCPDLDYCNSRPEEAPLCTENFRNCLVHLLLVEERNSPRNTGLARFQRRRQHAELMGYYWPHSTGANKIHAERMAR